MFFSYLRVNNKKYSVFLSPEKIMYDRGIYDDLVDFKSFYI